MTDKRKISLKERIFGGFLLFVVLFLAILWMSQTVYLERIYCRMKIVQTEKTVSEACGMIGNIAGQREKLDALAKDNEMKLVIVRQDGQMLYSSASQYSSNMAKHFLAPYYENAAENGGKMMGFVNGDARNRNIPSFPEVRSQEQEKKYFKVMKKYGAIQESLICVRIGNGDQKDVMVIAALPIMPVAATVSTIRTILLAVSLAMLLFGFIMATYYARSIGMPIYRISEDAGRIAEGDYTVRFPDSGTMEISELSATLNTTVQELSKTSALQREIVANVSHDLRTPLTMIKGYAEVMRDIPGENTAENLQIVIDETERLSSLVSDILDVSRMQADVVQLNLKTYSLTESIRKVLERYACLVRNEGFMIDFEADEEVFVTADEDRIYQVLYNLINNAVNYAGEDRCVHVIQQVNGAAVRVMVRDHGEGIAAEDLPYVWERYFRSSGRHRTERIGTGLGLSIVKQILKRHGAVCGVESTPGEGSTFWFELPTADKEEADEP